MAAIVPLIAEILANIPAMIAAGISVADLLSKARAAVDANRAPGDAEWDALDAQVVALQARLNTDPA